MILGRQPALGLAELEALFGADSIRPLGGAAIVKNDGSFAPSRLGGTIKACKLLDTLPFTDWQKITDYLVEHVPKHTCCFGPGKLTFGISSYGLDVTPARINATGLSVKKAVKATGRPVRVVPNKTAELNSAQVLHNKMTDLPLGMELVLIKHGGQTLLGQTIAVQDIEAYAARDQARPKRDARVGMLPPKLAQLIINLAAGQIESHESGVMSQEITVLDPFCGTGVVLQEALLMGYQAYGTDLEPRMIDFSKTNLDWLASKFQIPNSKFQLETGDATNHQWDQPFDIIAAETYLGRPFSAPPKPEVLAEVMQDVDTIHKKFLQNVAKQTKPGFRMCIAVPAWKIGDRKKSDPSSIQRPTSNVQFQHLKVLASLEELGYTRIKFVHVSNDDLIYHRPNQIVARELVVLERK